MRYGQIGVGGKGVAQGVQSGKHVLLDRRAQNSVSCETAARRTAQRDHAHEIAHHCIELIPGGNRHRERRADELRRGDVAPREMIQRTYQEHGIGTNRPAADIGERYRIHTAVGLDRAGDRQAGVGRTSNPAAIQEISSVLAPLIADRQRPAGGDTKSDVRARAGRLTGRLRCDRRWARRQLPLQHRTAQRCQPAAVLGADRRGVVPIPTQENHNSVAVLGKHHRASRSVGINTQGARGQRAALQDTGCTVVRQAG